MELCIVCDAGGVLYVISLYNKHCKEPSATNTLEVAQKCGVNIKHVVAFKAYGLDSESN